MLSGPRLIQSSDWGHTTTTKNAQLGATGETTDGRVFKYGQAGASNLAVGKLTITPLGVANHQNLAVTAAAASGTKSVSVTLGATQATADQYAGGHLTVYDSTGAGTSYLVSGHAAIGSAGSGTIYLAEPITTALTTSSKVSLTVATFSSLIISDASGTATTDVFTGVPGVAVSAGSFGWFQTRGVASVLTDGTPAVGAGVVQGTTAGAVAVEAAASVGSRLGVVQAVSAVNTKYNTINLAIQTC